MVIRATDISLGAGEILIQRRNGAALDTVTAVAAPAPTTTTFSVLIAGATFNVGDIVNLTSAIAARTNLAAEAATAPRILSKVLNGANYDYVVDKAFSGAPPTTAGGITRLWTDLGSTDGSITATSTVKTEPVYVDQAPDPVGVLLQSRETLISAPLAESSLFNVAAGFGVAPGAVNGVLQIGATSAIREDRVLLILPGPNGTKRFLVAHRCVNEGTTTLRAAKDGKSLVELNMRVYLDTTLAPAVQLLDIKDV